MRAPALLLPLLFLIVASTSLFGADATIRVVAPAQVTAGTEVTFEFIPNITQAATTLSVDGSFHHTYGGIFGFLITRFEASGWTCSGLYGNSFNCSMTSPGAGEKVIRVRALAQNFEGEVHIGGFATIPNDENYQNNSASTRMMVASSPTKADLVLTFSNTPDPVPTNTPVRFTATVTNKGPAPVDNVFVIVNRNIFPAQIDTLRGWNCVVAAASYSLVCQTGRIAPGGTSKGEHDGAPIAQATEIYRQGTIWGAGIEDPNPTDNSAMQILPIGVPEEFTFFLFPTAIRESPGAEGARWSSDLAVRYRGDEEANLFPTVSECRICTCIPEPPFGYPVPKDQTFSPALYYSERNPARLMYTQRDSAAEFSLSLRVRDTARQTENAGTEIPVVTESMLRSDVIDLINIPIREGFRRTLRIYDPYNRPGSQVRIRILADDNSTSPLLGEMTVTLEAAEDDVASPLNLPVLPGYAQIPVDLTQFPSLASASRVRIELVPLTPGLRFWGFLSMTNNLTNLITTVTPQPAVVND